MCVKRLKMKGRKKKLLWGLAALCSLVIFAAALLCYPLAENISGSAAGSEFTAGLKIDLNTADLETLCLLPGVGEKRAAAIIEYRTLYGAIEEPEELLSIPGIDETLISSWDGMLVLP